jgi:hypothetical protein
MVTRILILGGNALGPNFYATATFTEWERNIKEAGASCSIL